MSTVSPEKKVSHMCFRKDLDGDDLDYFENSFLHFSMNRIFIFFIFYGNMAFFSGRHLFSKLTKFEHTKFENLENLFNVQPTFRPVVYQGNTTVKISKDNDHAAYSHCLCPH